VLYDIVENRQPTSSRMDRDHRIYPDDKGEAYTENILTVINDCRFLRSAYLFSIFNSFKLNYQVMWTAVTFWDHTLVKHLTHLTAFLNVLFKVYIPTE